MEQTAVLAAPSVVRGPEQVEVSANRRRIDVARKAILLWSGIDGSCSSPVAVEAAELRMASSGLFASNFRCTGATRVSLTAGVDRDPFAGTKHGFTERSVTITRAVDTGDRVISYVRFTGRHAGEYRGHAPTGRLMQADGSVIHRFDEYDRIVQKWSVVRWG